MPAGTDKYVNVLLDSVTMSAANTLTYEEINIGLSTFDRVGLMIHRIEYFISAATMSDQTTDDDVLQMALCASNSPTAIGSDERSVYNKAESFISAMGTPATMVQTFWPIVADLGSLPNGGLLIPPRPLYLAATTVGFEAAAKVFVRLYFTTIQLKDADYFELLETFRFFE